MSEHSVSSIHRRPRRSRAEVARIASSYPQSGLSRSQFCRQYGVSLSTLDRYCQDARHRDALQSASVSRSVGTVELPLAQVEFVEKTTTHIMPAAPLRVELASGRRIAVPCGFDATTLTRLIAVLEQA